MDFQPTSPGMIRVLAQHGAAGLVSCFGSVHGIACARGDQVVVQTSRGVEMAKVLQTGDIAQPPTGELLRKATAADTAAHAAAGQLAAEILAAAQKLIETQTLPQVVVEAEVLLSHDVAICYYLGEADIRLGPVAMDLSRQEPPLRVQFAPLATTGASLPAVDSAPPVVDQPPTLPPDTTWRERLKHESNQLRGNIAAELKDDNSEGRLSRETAGLLEFHGVYQQAAVKSAGGSKPQRAPRRLMVRVNPPGGALSSTQLLATFDLARKYGDGTLRITSRQGLQLHGVLRGDVTSLVQQLNDRLINTFGACGDVTRNIVCCPAPGSAMQRKLQQAAHSLAKSLLPAPAAYHEIWLGDPHDGATMEPLYGAAYLPHKLKFAFCAADHNCVDLLTHDVGFVADEEDGRLAGFHCVVGGGLATRPSDTDSIAALAQPLGYVPASELTAVATAILQWHRDHGRRDKHHFGRLRYLVREWGIERLRGSLQETLGNKVLQPREFDLPPATQHLGWHATADGCYAGVVVPSGRINATIFEGLRHLLQEKSRRIRLTPAQNMIIGDLTAEHRNEFCFDDLPLLPSRTMTCPALPTCKLATGEAERIAQGLAAELQQVITGAGLNPQQAAEITFGIAGCHNACSHPQTSSIGLIASSKAGYDVLLGGDAQHLGEPYARNLTAAEIPDYIRSVIHQYVMRGQPGETFAAFCRRDERCKKATSS